MWAQIWIDRFDDVMPYSNAPLINLTRTLNENNYTIHRMYRTAEDFFTSIGFERMTSKFWTRSLFVKPNDRDVICQGAASNFDYHDDFRVRMCTQITDADFYTIHHEMGHIQYYMSYNRQQPYVYRDGANSAFHEAIGDTIGMYASKYTAGYHCSYVHMHCLVSPEHLVRLGFLDRSSITSDYEMNFLLRMALQKVAFLPFAYVMDTYRFLLFGNQIDRQHDLNSKWWTLRIQHSGIMPAVSRNNENNFDPAAKFHISMNVPYFRYFIAHILQFQFHRAMCRLKGHVEQLHMCDIYGRKDIGQRFKQMLAMGNGKSWQDILEYLTGERQLTSKAMLEYFQPLHQWLEQENRQRGYPIGWM
jgi:peptidyl-dipeptidase A